MMGEETLAAIEGMSGSQSEDNQPKLDDVEVISSGKKRDHESDTDSSFNSEKTEAKPKPAQKRPKKMQIKKPSAKTKTHVKLNSKPSVLELVDESLHIKLNKVISTITNLAETIKKVDTKINILTTKVSDIEEKVLTYAPDINIFSEIQALKDSINQCSETITPSSLQHKQALAKSTQRKKAKSHLHNLAIILVLIKLKIIQSKLL